MRTKAEIRNVIMNIIVFVFFFFVGFRIGRRQSLLLLFRIMLRTFYSINPHTHAHVASSGRMYAHKIYSARNT